MTQLITPPNLTNPTNDPVNEPRNSPTNDPTDKSTDDPTDAPNLMDDPINDPINDPITTPRTPPRTPPTPLPLPPPPNEELNWQQCMLICIILRTPGWAWASESPPTHCNKFQKQLGAEQTKILGGRLMGPIWQNDGSP